MNFDFLLLARGWPFRREEQMHEHVEQFESLKKQNAELKAASSEKDAAIANLKNEIAAVEN